MEITRTRAVVRDGRVTVNVPAEEGATVTVIIEAEKTSTELDALLDEFDRVVEARKTPAPDPRTLRKWLDEGRV